MKKTLISKKFIIKVILLLLVFTNFSISFAYWASNIATEPISSDSSLQIGQWDFIDSETELAITNFRTNHAAALALTTETVQVSDKASVEQALAAYGLLTESAKTALIEEKELLLSLLTEIIAFENSEFLDFEGFVYDNGLTGTVTMNGRTWFGNAVYIANDPAYDVWNDTRSLALNTGAYFESRDFFITGIDKITIYHGALNFNNGASFQFRIEYELQTNPGVWVILQEGGSNLLIDVISATPLSYSEININITEALNIRFTPVINNTTDYINLDDIRIYEHVVSEAIEVETFRTVYANTLSLTVFTVNISDRPTVEAALAAYNLLSLEAKAVLTSEKALLDSLLVEIILQENDEAALQAVITAEESNSQVDLDFAQTLVTNLPEGTTKTALQLRLDAVQDIIDSAALFRSDYASILALTVLTVQVTDQAAIEQALAAYNLLNLSVKAELTVEYTLITDLLTEINNQTPTSTQVSTFRANHAAALALTLETVEISDKAIIEAALTAYEVLSAAAKTELNVEKALLDSLFIEVNELEATSYVEIAELTNLQIDVNIAQVFVSNLPNGATKTALQQRLDTVQAIINTNAASAVEALIAAIPTTGEIALTDMLQIEEARASYGALTTTQKQLVGNLAILVSAEAELVALQDATNQVVVAEGSNQQSDVDLAQVLVSALPNGTSKTLLQQRINAVQDIIDVEVARVLIIDYFASNTVKVQRLNNADAIKQTAFLNAANGVVSGLGVTISVTNTNRINNTNTIYTINIVKNGAIVSISVNVVFTR